MNSHLTQNLASRGVKGDFKFTDTQSFRLFVEGMKGLSAYERSAEQDSLRTAETKLVKCVKEYPQDVLPQFYLGVVKVFQGYRGVDEAIRVFENIEQNVPVLRPAAMYNLAAAYIEQYTLESLDLARNWLKKCIKELGKDESVERASLRLQAEVLLLFYEIRQRLWVKRTDPVDALREELDNTVPELQGKLDEFLVQANAARRIPDAARTDIMADYWNDRGILEEFQAWTAPNPKEKKKRAETAINSYEESLKWKLNWIPPKSYMARVYMDLLEDYDSAIRCWQEVQQVRPDDNYAEYMLGRLFEKKGDLVSAISHYEKAPYIPEAKKRRAFLYEQFSRLGDAIRVWQEILAKRPEDKDALAARVRLRFTIPTPASDAEPTT